MTFFSFLARSAAVSNSPCEALPLAFLLESHGSACFLGIVGKRRFLEVVEAGSCFLELERAGPVDGALGSSPINCQTASVDWRDSTGALVMAGVMDG